jgi:hypothetical protein
LYRSSARDGAGENAFGEIRYLMKENLGKDCGDHTRCRRGHDSDRKSRHSRESEGSRVSDDDSSKAKKRKKKKKKRKDKEREDSEVSEQQMRDDIASMKENMRMMQEGLAGFKFNGGMSGPGGGPGMGAIPMSPRPSPYGPMPAPNGMSPGISPIPPGPTFVGPGYSDPRNLSDPRILPQYRTNPIKQTNDPYALTPYSNPYGMANGPARPPPPLPPGVKFVEPPPTPGMKFGPPPPPPPDYLKHTYPRYPYDNPPYSESAYSVKEGSDPRRSMRAGAKRMFPPDMQRPRRRGPPSDFDMDYDDVPERGGNGRQRARNGGGRRNMGIPNGLRGGRGMDDVGEEDEDGWEDEEGM